VLELPTASLFYAVDGAVRTPPLSDHILDSITRRIVIDVTGASEAATAPADLDRADEAFAASSVFEVLAVSRIEERRLATGGPVTTAAMHELRARVAAAPERD
jgi:branched-chain amino acid aminotransferase